MSVFFNDIEAVNNKKLRVKSSPRPKKLPSINLFTSCILPGFARRENNAQIFNKTLEAIKLMTKILNCFPSIDHMAYCRRVFLFVSCLYFW